MLVILRSSVLLLLIGFLSTGISGDLFAQIPSFPGAQGFGTTTPGGRGGQIIKVTNLNDRGEGTLRAALETEGPRIVVFETGGTITLESKLEINHPFITIAGQTAPGSGISIRGEGLRIATHDVVVRFLRIRPGDVSFSSNMEWSGIDGITIGSADSTKRDEVYNIVIDHCSISWAIDENIGIWFDAHDITIQNSIISEALLDSRHEKGPHSMGMLIGNGATNISLHHNIFALNNDRNPLLNGESVIDFRNNLIYGAGSRASSFEINAGSTVQSQKVNYVNNLVIPGPESYYRYPITVGPETQDVLQLYLKGNIWNNHNESPSVLALSSNIGFAYGTTPGEVFENIAANNSFTVPYVETMSTSEAYSFLLENAGAILPDRDAVDGRIVYQIEKRIGRLINSQNQVGGWPVLDEGIAPVDSDQDGMNDLWEEKNNLLPDLDDSSSDPDGDGYTNIEEYINGTNPHEKDSGSNSADPMGIKSLMEDEAEMDLPQNFPNPFRSQTTIQFSVGQPSNTILQIFNTTGRKVAKLVDSFLIEGTYEIFWDANHYSSGIYIVYLSIGSKQVSRKMTLIK